MTHFARHLAVFFVFMLVFAGITPQNVWAEDTGGHSVLGTIDPIVRKLSDEQASRKSSGVPDSLLSMGFNPGCPPEIKAKIENTAAISGKVYQGSQKDQYDQGVVKAEDASCFGATATKAIATVTQIWKDSCAGGGGSVGSIAKCMAMSIMEKSFKQLGKEILEDAKKQACKIVADVVERQLTQCIKVGFSMTIQKPQFKGLSQCLVQLRAIGNLNVNLNSFNPIKDSSFKWSQLDASAPIWDQFNAKCGATTVSDLPTALLTKDCWAKVTGTPFSGVQTCQPLDPAILKLITLAEASGTTQATLSPVLSGTKDADGHVAWLFKVSDSKYAIEPSCYGYSHVESVCAADPTNPNDTSKCGLVEVGKYCCDPSVSSCADAPDMPICAGTCCDKGRNNCAKLNTAVPECVNNASCIGSMEKVFAVGADGSKVDTGGTVADIMLNSAEKTVWTKLKHIVKPDAEVAGQACCATPWCNLCPQDIVIEDMRLQGKTNFPFGVTAGSGVILAEGTSPPAGKAKSFLGTSCGNGRVKMMPAEIIQFIFEHRPGDKYTEGAFDYIREQKNNANNRQTKDILSAIKSGFSDLFSSGGISFGEFSFDETLQGNLDIRESLVLGENRMVYQPLYAQGLPVNYAKIMKDGEVKDVPLCSALDFCPIEIDVDANGNPILKGTGSGGTGSGGTGGTGTQCKTSSDACKAQCGSDTSCYNSCCGITGSAGTGSGGTGSGGTGSGGTGSGGTGSGGTGSGGTGSGGSTTVQQCQNACTGTDAQELACRHACAGTTGTTGTGTTTGGTTGGGGTGGGGNKVEDPSPGSNLNNSVVVNPTTQAPTSTGVLDTLKSLF